MHFSILFYTTIARLAITTPTAPMRRDGNDGSEIVGYTMQNYVHETNLSTWGWTDEMFVTGGCVNAHGEAPSNAYRLKEGYRVRLFNNLDCLDQHLIRPMAGYVGRGMNAYVPLRFDFYSFTVWKG